MAMTSNDSDYIPDVNVSTDASFIVEDTQPSTAATPQPSTSATPQPFTSATPQPSISTTPQPSTSATPQPSSSTTGAQNLSATETETQNQQPMGKRKLKNHALWKRRLRKQKSIKVMNIRQNMGKPFHLVKQAILISLEILMGTNKSKF